LTAPWSGGPAPAPDPLVEGRSLTRINLWRIFWVSAIVTMLAVQGNSGQNASAAWLRLAAIALLCLLVYRGLRWALWALGVFAVLAGALMVFAAVAKPEMSVATRLLFGATGALQVAAFVILVRAPAVRTFMAAQRTVPAKPE
jgi:hypothetical protein